MAKKKQSKGYKTRLNQWHPAFYAGIQIELEKEGDKLTFIREHPLATKPILIDVLIIKKNTEDNISKNIGRIFRKHNIIEYKSPTAYLSIIDFYKVYAYASYYIGSQGKIGEISDKDVTLTFVTSRYPRRMIEHIRNSRGIEVKKIEDGIYYLLGDVFPMQVVVSKRLSADKNLWLRALTNDLKEHSLIDKVASEYQKHKDNELFKSIMNIITNANSEQFKEGKDMCEALREIWADDIERARSEGLRLGMEEGREEGMTLSVVTLLDVKDTVSTPLKEKIHKEKDIEILKSWVKLAASVSSAEEFEDKMYQ